MALILEVGVGLANADALISVTEARAYAASRGLTLPAADTDVEVLIRKCNDWLTSVESRFQGWRRNPDQALPFPRVGISLAGRSAVFGYSILSQFLSESIIPPTLKTGLCQLVFELQTADALPSVTDPRIVIQETVGPISTTYAGSGTNSANPVFPKVLAYIEPLFKQGGLLRAERA